MPHAAELRDRGALAVAAAAYLVIRTLRALDQPGASRPAVIIRGLVGIVVSLAFLSLLVGVIGHFMTGPSRLDSANSALRRLEQRKQTDPQTRPAAGTDKADSTPSRLDQYERTLQAHPAAAAAAEKPDPSTAPPTTAP